METWPYFLRFFCLERLYWIGFREKYGHVCEFFYSFSFHRHSCLRWDDKHCHSGIEVSIRRWPDRRTLVSGIQSCSAHCCKNCVWLSGFQIVSLACQAELDARLTSGMTVERYLVRECPTLSYAKQKSQILQCLLFAVICFWFYEANTGKSGVFLREEMRFKLRLIEIFLVTLEP